MHALLVQLEIDPERAEGAVDFLHQTVIPMISSGAGFVKGTWMRSEDGLNTRSLIVYDSKEAADQAADRARQGPPPGAPTRFVSADVFEVVAEA